MSSASRPRARGDCPAWCVLRHTTESSGAVTHVGGALMVRDTVMRLSTTRGPWSAAGKGPYVLVGDADFTLHEAEALLAALTQLVDQGRASLVAQQPDGALPILDP